MQFERPIPGQSLTQPPKSAPYERPPEITDPMEALERHLDTLNEPKAIEDCLFFLEMGVDLVTLVEGILRNAVLEGIHSIDISLIIAPVIHEFIKGNAEAAGVEYDEGFEDKKANDQATYSRNIARATKMLQELDIEAPQEDTPPATVDDIPEETTEPEIEEAPRGLMARA